ncbi:MAG: YbhB/YbcL family Raf kinase inhibitor-like protein [Candidatus Parcubacteria bacterium]|nr:YbhB/YbcL family Raf kinase inhibitor-like protein [Candidatus Parcubacteria bacterium]
MSMRQSINLFNNLIFIGIVLIVFLSSCTTRSVNLNINNINMKLTSPVFTNNSNLPAKYTCDGQGINPSLTIVDIPDKAQSLALISDDPDAPSGTFVHWLVWNIDPKTTEIAENSVPTGSNLGKTSANRTGYVAPCPPSGIHRYFFKIFALDIKLDLTPNAGKDNLEKAMQGHILDSVEIIGLYKRK